MCVPCDKVSKKKIRRDPKNSIVITMPGENTGIFAPDVTLEVTKEHNTVFSFSSASA